MLIKWSEGLLGKEMHFSKNRNNGKKQILNMKDRIWVVEDIKYMVNNINSNRRRRLEQK